MDYIEEFSQFQGRTLEEIYEKMVHAAQTHNAFSDNDDRILYVKRISDYKPKKKKPIRRAKDKDYTVCDGL